MTPGTEMTRATSGRLVRRSQGGVVDVVPPPTPARRTPRWSRRRGVLAVFAGLSALGFVAASVGPTGAALAEVDPDRVSLYESALADVQTYALPTGGVTPATLERSSYSVYVTPKPTPTPTPRAAEASGASPTARWTPPFIAPDPGTAQAIAYEMVLARGWGDDQFACLRALWQKESGWRVNAYNASSGAYGIPQSLPGSKMASAGADWETNPATQITWGLGYISGRYGDPCGAWASSQSRGWY